MSNQTPEGRRVGVTLIYDTGERDDDALERMQWVLPMVFLGAALVLFFGVAEWMDPHVPLALFAALIWLPMGAFLLWRLGVGKWQKIAMVMVITASFSLPLMAWNVGLYRALAFTMMHELTPADLSMRASEDRNDRVAAMACEQMLASQELAKIRRAQRVLENRPDMATQCLDGLDEEGRGAVVRLARHLHVHWYRGWMGDEESVSTEVGCEAAHRYVEIGQLYGDASTPQLLSCALGSEIRESARCCAEALGEAGQLSSTVEPEDWIHDLEMPLFELLVDAADLPAQQLLADEPVGDSMQWTPRELFHWKTRLGCHLTQREAHPESIARQLSRTIETQCGLDIDDPLYSQAGVRFVERTCEEAVPAGDGEQMVDVMEWCEAARTANLETAVESAKFVVHRAHRSQGIDLLEEVIKRGSLWEQQLGDGQSRFALDGRGQSRVVDEARADGVRLGRAQWTEHTPEAEQRRQAMEETHDQRRRDARQRLEEQEREGTDEELRREVEREAGQQVIDDIEELRQQGR